MKSRRLLGVLWLVLQLLFAQQQALAHFVAHLGEAPVASAATQAQAEDDAHGSAHALTEVCVACLALAGLAGAVVGGGGGWAAPLGGSAGRFGAASPAPSFQCPSAFDSRAPPAFSH